MTNDLSVPTVSVSGKYVFDEMTMDTTSMALLRKAGTDFETTNQTATGCWTYRIIRTVSALDLIVPTLELFIRIQYQAN